MAVHRTISGIVVAGLLAVTCGCGRHPMPASIPLPDKARVVESSSGPVTASLTIEPAAVRLDRDTLLTLRIVSPSNITTVLPAIEGRVEGFTVAGAYDHQPETRDGRTSRERHVRLTPQMAPRYRIAPMAITWSRPGDSHEQWFPSKPVVLDIEPLTKGPATELAGPMAPFWVFPDPGTILAYTAAALLVAAILYLTWRLLRRIHRAIKLKRMSPRERALFELNELLEQRLIEKDQVKEFYFALTMIVRCYIERAHSIRAPEQTTEEFLIAVSRDERFSRDVVSRLRDFLNAADLVKYAAFRPGSTAVEQATSTARHYIENDSDNNQPSPIPINH